MPFQICSTAWLFAPTSDTELSDEHGGLDVACCLDGVSVIEADGVVKVVFLSEEPDSEFTVGVRKIAEFYGCLCALEPVAVFVLVADPNCKAVSLRHFGNFIKRRLVVFAVPVDFGLRETFDNFHQRLHPCACESYLPAEISLFKLRKEIPARLVWESLPNVVEFNAY